MCLIKWLSVTNLEEKMARCAILILLGLNLYIMFDPILIASIILGYDIWFYISHLILHMPWFFNNIHKEHHALIPKKMTFTDAYVGHRSEGIFQGLGIFLPFALFKPAKNSIRTADLYSSWFVTDNDLNPSTKGADLNLYWFKYDVYDSTTIASAGVALILINLRGMARHDDRSTWLIGNHHLLHHVHPNANYGEYWLDWLFGTILTESKYKEEYVKGIIYM